MIYYTHTYCKEYTACKKMYIISAVIKKLTASFNNILLLFQKKCDSSQPHFQKSSCNSNFKKIRRLNDTSLKSELRTISDETRDLILLLKGV